MSAAPNPYTAPVPTPAELVLAGEAFLAWLVANLRAGCLAQGHWDDPVQVARVGVLLAAEESPKRPNVFREYAAAHLETGDWPAARQGLLWLGLHIRTPTGGDIHHYHRLVGSDRCVNLRGVLMPDPARLFGGRSPPSVAGLMNRREFREWEREVKRRRAVPDDPLRIRFAELAQWLSNHRDGRNDRARFPYVSAILARLWPLDGGEWLAVGDRAAFTHGLGDSPPPPPPPRVPSAASRGWPAGVWSKSARKAPPGRRMSGPTGRRCWRHSARRGWNCRRSIRPAPPGSARVGIESRPSTAPSRPRYAHDGHAHCWGRSKLPPP